MTVSMIDLKAMHSALAGEVNTAVQDVLESGWYILGAQVQAFEAAFASYHGVAHAVAVANGTDAIELALRAHDIGPGDEVITVAHTAMPTVTAVERAGANPVLVDILPNTYTMDPAAAEAAITTRTKAIIPVHLYGHPVDIQAFQTIAEKHSLLLLEDCAQSHGATYNGQLTGTFGHIAAFSFYPTKNLGAYGDAGAIITDDDAIADKLRRLRNYGQETRYHNAHRGVNSRMDDLQAAILNVKLRYLDQHNEVRRQLAATYTAALTHVTCPTQLENCKHVYHLYVIRLSERDPLRDHLQANGVQTTIHYPVPIHRQPSHQDLSYTEGSLPVTEACAREIVSLPLHVQLTPDDQHHVIDLIQAFTAR